MLAKGVGSAIITLGEKGALLHTAKGSELVPAYEVGPVVETTGAGDAFNGGLAVGLSRGFAPVDAVRFGCAVAGISVTGPAPRRRCRRSPRRWRSLRRRRLADDPDAGVVRRGARHVVDLQVRAHDRKQSRGSLHDQVSVASLVPGRQKGPCQY